MNRVIAILPMRGGSQRVKNKNTRLIRGRPLYEHIVATLLESKYVSRIAINTDINEVLQRYSTDRTFLLIQRDENLRGNCSMNLVIESTLQRVAGNYFIQVHATNPLLTSALLDNAIQTFFENVDTHDSLFSVTKMQKRFWDKDVKPINHDPNDAPTTQDLDPYFEENSCFYIFSRTSFYKRRNRIGENPSFFLTPFVESIDIDTEEEFGFVERILQCGDKSQAVDL
jgi:CMP-N-acetylneuraminic acid synthetase